MKNVHIIGVGSPLVDCLAHVPETFLSSVPGEKGGMELVDHHTIDEIIDAHDDEVINASGGSAANTIIGLSKLGVNCSFLGKLGKDSLGEFYTEAFSNSGVATNRFKYCDVNPTGRCLSMITPDSERTCRTYLGAAMNLIPEEILEDDFSDCSHAHVEGYILFNRDLSLKILASAKNAGCTISLDLASFEVVRGNKDIIKEILSDHIDIVFANEDESKEFCGSDDLIEGVNELSKYCDVAAVKAGADGAIIKYKNEIVKVPADKVNAIDTTGAGDLWSAGFLYAFFQGWDIKSCGLAGSKLGAAVVQQTGASIPEDVWDSLREQITSIMP